MTKRDEDLLTLRPQLAIDIPRDKNATEIFMHQILRPILKLQHPMLIRLIQISAHYDKLKLSGGSEQEKREKLKGHLQKNIGLRNLLIGVTIGMMTEEEVKDYLELEKALNKRMVEMIITRFLSQF